jgi:hypothetical protein
LTFAVEKQAGQRLHRPQIGHATAIEAGVERLIADHARSGHSCFVRCRWLTLASNAVLREHAPQRAARQRRASPKAARETLQNQF